MPHAIVPRLENEMWCEAIDAVAPLARAVHLMVVNSFVAHISVRPVATRN